jgi:glycosyltransferase involved in cell wall biosynthesis
VSQFLKENSKAAFLLVGKGPSEQEIKTLCKAAGVENRLFMAGVLQNQDLADALNAMDVFAFASKSETQGMVLTEAMAAGNPVVALDATGVREVVRDTINGRLLMTDSIPEYVQALSWVYERDDAQKRELIQSARTMADEFSLDATADRALLYYETLINERRIEWDEQTDSSLEKLLRYIGAEWDIVRSYTQAGDDTIDTMLLNSSDRE